MTKKRINRPDLTLRNLHALKKRLEAIETDNRDLFERLSVLEAWVGPQLHAPRKSDVRKTSRA